MVTSVRFQQEMIWSLQSGFSRKWYGHFSPVSAGNDMVTSVRFQQEMIWSFQAFPTVNDMVISVKK